MNSACSNDPRPRPPPGKVPEVSDEAHENWGKKPKLSPRAERTLIALFRRRKLTREQVDRVSGSSNGPDVVVRIRRRLNLEIPCRPRHHIDRDGRTVQPGEYSLTDEDRAKCVRLLQLGVIRTRRLPMNASARRSPPCGREGERP